MLKDQPIFPRGFLLDILREFIRLGMCDLFADYEIKRSADQPGIGELTMPMGLLFWVLMILWLIFGFLSGGAGEWSRWAFYGDHVLVFVLFALLGWKCFGKPIQG